MSRHSDYSYGGHSPNNSRYEKVHCALDPVLVPWFSFKNLRKSVHWAFENLYAIVRASSMTWLVQQRRGDQNDSRDVAPGSSLSNICRVYSTKISGLISCFKIFKLNLFSWHAARSVGNNRSLSLNRRKRARVSLFLTVKSGFRDTYLGLVKNWNGKEQRRCKRVGAWPHCIVSWLRVQLWTYCPTSTIKDCNSSFLSTALGLVAWMESLDTTDASSSAVQ